MNTVAFRPNKGKYLILPDEIKGQETKIGEYTIEASKDIHQKPAEGTVVAIGKECTEYEKGAKVLFGKYSGYEQTFDGIDYLILAETEILGERIGGWGDTTPIAVPKGMTVHDAVNAGLGIRTKAV